MSHMDTVVDGGGKYRISVEKIERAGSVRYQVHISVMDWGAGVTLIFDTFDQVSGFLSEMTQATLTCVSKASAA